MDEQKLSWTEKISIFFKRPLAAKAKARMTEQKERIREAEAVITQNSKEKVSRGEIVKAEIMQNEINQAEIIHNSKQEVNQSQVNQSQIVQSKINHAEIKLAEVVQNQIVQNKTNPDEIVQPEIVLTEVAPTKVVQADVVETHEVKTSPVIAQKGREGQTGLPSWKKALKNPLTLLKPKKKSTLPSPYISASYDMGQEYRVVAYNSRLISICFVSSLFVITGLSLCLFCLFPLKEIRPYLIGLRDKGDQVVHIEPAYKTAQSINRIAESLCRHYVTLRETINCVDEKLRWGGELYYFCSEEIWTDFTTHMNPMLPTSPVKQCQEKHATRSVKILLSTNLKDNIYRVEWELTITIRGQIAEKSHWVSLLEVEMRPITTKQTEEHVNPLGFTVTKYSVQPWEGRGEKAA